MSNEQGAIRSVDRALAALDALAGLGEAGATRIAADLGVHKSTASRLLHTLVAHDLVEQDPHSSRYRLGVGILRLAAATTARLDIVVEARPIAQELAEATGETVNIAVLSGAAALYVEQCAPPGPLPRHDWVGQHIPLHATSNGKVLLSGLSDEAILALLDLPLAAHTPATVTDPRVLLAQVAEVRERGWSLVADELEVGLRAVAAPVRNAQGGVPASLSVSGPGFRFTAEAAEQARTPLLEAAARISGRLGFGSV